MKEAFAEREEIEGWLLGSTRFGQWEEEDEWVSGRGEGTQKRQ